jgi:glutathione S-transferase
MMKLYYFPGNASFAPHVLLEETGADYELVLVDRSKGANKTADYLALNPPGRIPTLIDGDQVLFETAAICLHIADKYPDSHLAPTVGTPERSEFHQWLFYMATTIQPEILLYYYGDRHAIDEEGAAAVKAAAEARLGDMYAIMDEGLGAGPYMMGDQFTVLDPYLFMVCRWGRNFTHPPRAFKSLGPYLERLSKHPTIVTSFDQEQIEAPYI